MPAKRETMTLELGDGVTLELARIPAGTFLMGSPESEDENRTVGPDGVDTEGWPGRFPDETRHEVTLSEAFYMGIHQVTQAQYKAVTGTNPSGFNNRPDSPRRPVEMVNWHDAVAFCKKLSEKTGRNARLPTEAEWEYACRAGTTTPFNTGDTISADLANYTANFTYSGSAKGVFRRETTAVGSFPANAWGLHDMHGNVYEWCADWFGEYPNESVVDPQGVSDGTFRVLRGGSWGRHPMQCRSALRTWADPVDGSDDIGFRVSVD